MPVYLRLFSQKKHRPQRRQVLHEEFESNLLHHYFTHFKYELGTVQVWVLTKNMCLKCRWWSKL